MVSGSSAKKSMSVCQFLFRRCTIYIVYRSPPVHCYARIPIAIFSSINTTLDRETDRPLAARIALPWYSWTRAMDGCYFIILGNFKILVGRLVGGARLRRAVI